LDERYLYPEFIPEKLPYREKEIETLVYCFDPVLRARKPLNVFLAGSTGVGKTVCVKYVLNQLEESFDRAKSLYLNCFEYNSRPSVLIAIANFVGAGVPRRGLATDEIFTKMVEYLKKSGFVPIVILDEFDQLLISEQNSKLLYDLLRVVEYEKLHIGIVMISNDVSLTTKLDSRIRSSLAEQTIIFNSYSPSQLKGILKERCDGAFVKGAAGDDIISLAAAHAAKIGGDCRVALESLLRAGRLAERANLSKVSIEHLRSAFEDVDAVSALKSLKHLDGDEKMLLQIIAQNQPLASGKIYEIYSASGKTLKERRLRDILSLLERQNLISYKEVKLGNKGKTREYSCRPNKNLVLSELLKLGK